MLEWHSDDHINRADSRCILALLAVLRVSKRLYFDFPVTTSDFVTAEGMVHIVIKYHHKWISEVRSIPTTGMVLSSDNQKLIARLKDLCQQHYCLYPVYVPLPCLSRTSKSTTFERHLQQRISDASLVTRKIHIMKETNIHLAHLFLDHCIIPYEVQ